MLSAPCIPGDSPGQMSIRKTPPKRWPTSASGAKERVIPSRVAFAHGLGRPGFIKRGAHAYLYFDGRFCALRQQCRRAQASCGCPASTRAASCNGPFRAATASLGMATVSTDNDELSLGLMKAGPLDPAQALAQQRLDNALALFEEFVRATARHADAATLRGLERRFAERVQIQPSYWSQIKGRSRQIGERLARQFEHCCHKPPGWMDLPHRSGGSGSDGSSAAMQPSAAQGLRGEPVRDDSQPRDDDERFIMGLVLTYYRRHPQRARTRLLDLRGEVLTPQGYVGPAPAAAKSPAPLSAAAEDAHALWQRTQSGVAPLKRKK